MRIVKLGVFRNDDQVLMQGALVDGPIFRSVPSGQVARVDDIVPCFAEDSADSHGEVRINEELHLKTRC